jgi:hypothetical protein
MKKGTRDDAAETRNSGPSGRGTVKGNATVDNAHFRVVIGIALGDVIRPLRKAAYQSC